MKIEDYFNNGVLFDGRYQLLRPLSSDGATADVWLAEDTYTQEGSNNETENRHRQGMVVALKIYRVKNALDIEGKEKFRKEFIVVYNCHHSNLLQPTNYSICNDIPYLVIPYCPLGSSEKLIGKITRRVDLYKYIYQVSSGLAYLHAKEPAIIHQDIKPANILILSNNDYAITDFGISINAEKTSIDNNAENDRIDNNAESNSGTMAYMAPERFKEDYTPIAASDIWSLGATLFEIITGNVPFGEDGGENQAKGVAMQSFGKTCPLKVRKLILACLNKDPKKRPTANDIACRFALNQEMHHFGRYIILTFFVLSILFVIPLFWELSPTQNESEETDSISFPQVVELLHNNPDVGFEELIYLSESGDSRATFLLSRLYFRSNVESELLEDSIAMIRDRCNIQTDNGSAHRLLLRAVEQDTTNYMALYELGCDYMAGKSRDESYTRDENRALSLFKRSHFHAAKAGDIEFKRKSHDKITFIEEQKY